MNYTDFVDVIAKKTKLPKDTTKKTVEVIRDVIADALSRGENVQLSGFGSFSVTERAAREGRNPANGETIHILAKKVAVFKPAKNLKDKVKE